MHYGFRCRAEHWRCFYQGEGSLCRGVSLSFLVRDRLAGRENPCSPNLPQPLTANLTVTYFQFAFLLIAGWSRPADVSSLKGKAVRAALKQQWWRREAVEV